MSKAETRVSREGPSPAPTSVLGVPIDMTRRPSRGIARYILSFLVKPPPAPISDVDVTTEAWACVRRFEAAIGIEMQEPMRSKLLTAVSATVRRTAIKVGGAKP